ncbi:MAG: YibE/F family protein [bacterium]|nr:YibE/F family protein [bacterium]
MKKIIIFLIMIIFGFLPVFSEEEAQVLPSQIGVVQKVEYVDFQEGDDIQTKQTAEIKLLEGTEKGAVISIDNMLTGNPYYDIKLKKGVKVVLHVESGDDDITYSIEDIKRSDTLIWLSLLFCSLLIYVGKKKGIFSLVSIILTCILIYFLLIPMILIGINPVLASIIICVLSTAITMYLVGGFNQKSTSATIGCSLSLVFAGLLSFVAVNTAHLTGLSNENEIFLYSAHPELNFVAITISMIILATLGAVMDVGMSIASTINEIYSVDNTKTVKELFICGMNVGRDIIGTMANTLILVYLGGSLPLLLLASNIDFQKFINLNQVVTEITSAIIGSSAIVICVPITAFIASELVKNIPQKYDFSKLKDNMK